MNLLCCLWMTMAPNAKVTRKWEVFAGRNKFYCDGFLMSAPNTGVFYLTLFLITGTSVLFFAFDCPYLTLQITPVIPVVGAILYFFTMGSLLRTTFTDPGVIPRASQDEAAYIEKQIEVPNSLNSPTYRPPPRTKEVLVKGQTVKLKYCFTCKIFRPPRASHCSLCDNCVDRFDHHCPWVGNCVGKRNYRFFYMFIVSLAFLAVFIFSCSLTHLILLAKDNNQEFILVIQQAPFSVVVTFICFFSIWSVIGLAGFHTYLTTSDQTTNEDIKGSFSSKGAQHSVNPYSHGNVCLNCFYILCGPMTPSLIDRRGIVTDEYRIQMQPPDRYNNAMQSPQLMINQPKISSDHHKSIYYDLELDPNIINSGVYRQRSYENLEKGQSNSIARLVDNELPVSTLNSPVVEVDECLSPVCDYDEEPTPFLGHLNNNLNGSYTNLFRADVKCDTGDNGDNGEGGNNCDGIGDKHNSNSMVDQSNQSKVCTKITNSRTENLYSNIPTKTQSTFPTNQIHTCSGGRDGDSNSIARSRSSSSGTIDEKFDPNQHVYSNVMAKTTTVPSATQSFVSNDSTTTTSVTAAASVTATTTAAILLDQSSIMLTDDLDLDDPVMVASSFGGCGTITSPKTLANTTTLIGMPPVRQITTNESAELKTTIPHVIITDATQNYIATTSPTIATSTTTTTITTTNTINTTTKSNHSISNNSAFCSPSRMRLLHDTTMIDTALDLDSLDGSSIGNNSQACLVKTAIV